MVKVLPELVWPYARIVQLKPSRKRERSGRAVEVKSACWVLSGGWTWSNVKTCFLALAAADELAAEAVLAPDAEGVEDVASTVTEVEEAAWMTAR